MARTVCGEDTEYDQGIWFNSAKFFDLEWQIYGDVPARPGEDVETLYWKHPDGRKSIRINYRRDDDTVTGFNLMGVRYRHDVCERWIRERWPVGDVLENLPAANFDPEFFRQHEDELIDCFNAQRPGDKVVLRRRRGLWGTMRISR